MANLIYFCQTKHVRVYWDIVCGRPFEANYEADDPDEYKKVSLEEFVQRSARWAIVEFIQMFRLFRRRLELESSSRYHIPEAQPLTEEELRFLNDRALLPGHPKNYHIQCWNVDSITDPIAQYWGRFVKDKYPFEGGADDRDITGRIPPAKLNGIILDPEKRATEVETYESFRKITLRSEEVIGNYDQYCAAVSKVFSNDIVLRQVKKETYMDHTGTFYMDVVKQILRDEDIPLEELRLSRSRTGPGDESRMDQSEAPVDSGQARSGGPQSGR